MPLLQLYLFCEPGRVLDGDGVVAVTVQQVYLHECDMAKEDHSIAYCRKTVHTCCRFAYVNIATVFRMVRWIRECHLDPNVSLEIVCLPLQLCNVRHACMAPSGNNSAE